MILKKFLDIFKSKEITKIDTLFILMMILIFGGVFGFLYELIFYKIDLGYFVNRGSTYGPWIPIYAYGSILITIFLYRIKNKPILVFILSCLLTGLIEYLTGFILNEFFDIRLWDYNNEIWNFLNINGYICLRSVLFFGISSMFLIYLVIPLIIKIYKKCDSIVLRIIIIILTVLFFFDEIIYMILN